MELDTLFRLDGGAALFALGFDEHRVLRGFLHFAVVATGRALSLSSMPRHRDSPNGFNEWLIVETIAWAATAAHARSVPKRAMLQLCLKRAFV